MSRLAATSLFALAVCVAALALPAVAEACSCAGPPSEKEIGPYYAGLIERSDGAIIGKVKKVRAREGKPTIADDEAIYTVRIQRAVKRLAGKRRVRVHTSLYGASCGLELSKGDRAGLILNRRRNGWNGYLCGQIPPDWMRKAAQALEGGTRLAAADERSEGLLCDG